MQGQAAETAWDILSYKAGQDFSEKSRPIKRIAVESLRSLLLKGVWECRFDKFCMPQLGLILQNQHFQANESESCQKKFQLLTFQRAFRVLYFETKSVPTSSHFPHFFYGLFLFIIASYSSRN